MSTATRLFRNSALSFSTNVVTKAVNTIAFILIARLSQADQAGIFSLGTTYLVIFTATAWGLDELAFLSATQASVSFSRLRRWIGAP